jgi:phenylalanyl-tRNA synthetase beta chain
VQISLEWLSEFVHLPELEELDAMLTMAGVEVEEIHDPTTHLDGVVVGKILSCEKHPDADRLQVCEVTTGEDTTTVVCGAPNARAGLKVALATVGTQLAGLQVAARKVRGVESFGMLCSKAELGTGEDSDGIWELPGNYEVGQPLVEAASIAPTLVLGITPNRPDLLSHIGIAREIAALTGQRLKSVNWRLVDQGVEVGGQARVVVDDGLGCPRYLARVVKNVTVQESPAWLKRRLEAIGQRPINNVVDATNYVLFEYGQPLHAFDLAHLKTESGLPTIRVRRAAEGEVLETLDESERTLHPDDLIIADASHPVALAGVMGGASSEVSEATTDVLLECAYFDPRTVRRTARRHGMHTEASHRFERGADPGVLLRAIDRCAQLLGEIAGGEVSKGVVDVSQKGEFTRDITLRLKQVPRILGIELPPEEVVQLLEPLEIRCVSRNEDSLRFTTPSFRPDLEREADLIEEIARRYGYDKIPERLPGIAGPFISEEKGSEAASVVARRRLLAAGASEIVTFAIGSPSIYDSYAEKGPLVKLLNPLGEELSALRTSLLPGLMSVYARNHRQGTKDLRIFEIGRTFWGRTPAADEDPRDRDLPTEEGRVACLIGGGRHDGKWYQKDDSVDFFDLMGLVETLVEGFDTTDTLQRRAMAVEGFNPHACAELRLGDEVIGVAGQVHPNVAQPYDLADPLFVAELSLDALERAQKRSIRFQSLPKFPGTRRDIAVIAPNDLPAETIRSFIKKNAGGDLESDVVEAVRLFDIYDGKPIPTGSVSLAYAIFYRSRERTLTDEEVGPAFEAVLEKVKSEFGVSIR